MTGMNQYKGGKGNDRQLYLKLWSGAALRIDRISRDSLYVSNPILSVTGAVQPSRVDVLSGDDGMTGRWLIAYLEDRGRSEPTDADLTFERRAWAGTVNALLSRVGDVDYSLSDDARDEFVRWRKAIIDRTTQSRIRLADYLGKLESHMARLALVLHVADDPATNGNADTVSPARATVARLLRGGRMADISADHTRWRLGLDNHRQRCGATCTGWRPGARLAERIAGDTGRRAKDVTYHTSNRDPARS